MELKEIIQEAEEKRDLAFKEYEEREYSQLSAAMAYYMKISNAFTELLVKLQSFK